jgi:hypothetical protein
MFRLYSLSLLAIFAGCQAPQRDEAAQPCSPAQVAAGSQAGVGALLATRFDSFEAFVATVSVTYLDDGSGDTARDGAAWVRVQHCSHGREITSILATGPSQDDIMEVKKNARPADILKLARRLPAVITYRAELERIHLLSRRVPLSYGEGDPAFYDLAEATLAHINTPDLAFRYPKDTTEKGYINTFNHMTAQAFITSIFSEELADFIADLHELKNMPQLTTGKFTPAQRDNPTDNPVDNYVDMLNNEWGQELGKTLKAKYHIRRTTRWTPVLLADYLNDIQRHYAWALEIGFLPFRHDDELVERFSAKLNVVLAIPQGNSAQTIAGLKGPSLPSGKPR